METIVRILRGHAARHIYVVVAVMLALLLRVALANRFGTRIGTRDFEPAEYLGHPNVRLMTPGERADATLDIQDPGKDAEGFEIDVCLRGDQTISCAADAATQGGAPQATVPQAKP